MATTQTKITNPPKQYTFAQLEQLWISAGGPRAIAPIMAAIAIAESGGRPTATHRNSNGTTDRGLWQINSVHKYSASSSLDPAQNAKQAVGVYHSQGLSAWSTFTNGRYKEPLAKGIAATKGNRTGPNVKTPAGQKPSGAPASSPGFIGDLGHDIGSRNITATAGDLTGIHQSNTIDPIVGAIELGLREAMYALAILGGAMLIVLGLAFVGIDIGLSSRNRVPKAVFKVGGPAGRAAGRVAKRGGGSPKAETTEVGNLPGPEA